GIQDEAMTHLHDYDWPGNVRELANLLQKALIFNRGAPIGVTDLTHIINPPVNGENTQTLDLDIIRQWVRKMMIKERDPYRFDDFMDIVSGIVISEALKSTDGNRTQAAKLLGMSRPTLHAKIEKHNIRMKTQISD
ncbi:MAG: sigma-54-dependent Fis family transcriptional regulator, partial [Desulfotignum sp.]|nr:sigma-54-dependent Fis family transcriptional regulator [Desulfotignum sp.]